MSLVLDFVVVFGVILALEFADRTNFALISLATREPPLAIWIGASAAFGLTTVLSVAVGDAAKTFLEPEIWLVRLAGGLFLLGYAGYLVVHHGEERPPPSGRSALTTAFLLILLLELGDTTMLVTVNFVLTGGSVLVVGVAAFLALATVAATATYLGPRIGAKVEPIALERAVIVILVIVGLVTILYALDPGAFPSLGD